MFVDNRQVFGSDCFFSIRWFDVECPERSGGNSELFNENDVTSLNERILLFNTVVITDRTKCLKEIKSLLLDSSKFMQLPIDKDNWINYIVNLENKLKDCFKVLKNEEKISKKEFDSTCPVGTTPWIPYGNPKVHKTVVKNTPKFRPIL